MKVQVTIEDSLKERVESVIEESVARVVQYMIDNRDLDTYYGMNTRDVIDKALDYEGSYHEIVDSNTPIYYSDIDGLYYLYGNELDEAYNNAGIGDGSEENHRQVAIYCYLEQESRQEIEDRVEEIKNYLDDIRDDMEEADDEEIEEEQIEYLESI